MALGGLGEGLGGNFWVIVVAWAGSGSQMRLGRRFWRLLDDFKRQDGSKLRPKRVPSCSQNSIRSDAEIDQKIDALQDRFLKRFGWILGGNMEASWVLNGVKIRSYLENTENQKILVKLLEF